jgi:hypothetical protein
MGAAGTSELPRNRAADSRFAGEKKELAIAGDCAFEPRAKLREFAFAADEYIGADA